MRIKKFRAFYENEMIFSDCAIGEYNFEFDADGTMVFSVWMDDVVPPDSTGMDICGYMVPYTKDVMQFIGFKDKNGKEIYEDDIVDCDRYPSHEIYQVVVDDIRILPTEMFGSAVNSITIVGNIHENPDLL